jgi:hypothetical protein
MLNLIPGILFIATLIFVLIDFFKSQNKMHDLRAKGKNEILEKFMFKKFLYYTFIMIIYIILVLLFFLLKNSFQ